jgi:hypothetical protein
MLPGCVTVTAHIKVNWRSGVGRINLVALLILYDSGINSLICFFAGSHFPFLSPARLTAQSISLKNFSSRLMRRLHLPMSANQAPARWVLCGIVIPLVSILLISVNQSLSQADIAGSILKGKIVDQNGSVVIGARVTVRNTERGVTRNVLTDAEGAYRLPPLQPGIYEIRVQADGFQSRLLTGVVLTVGQIAVRDVQLQIGQVAESVQVGDLKNLVETERTQQSATVERRQIATLPNPSRNFTSYIFTLPGVADVSAARVQQSRAINLPTSGFSMGAGNGRSNSISIDGGENDSGTGNLRIRNLSVEAVQEFQVNSNAFSAEYGFTASTAINVVTRGGTNAFHGSGYIFYRSEKTSASDPLNNTGSKPFEQRISPGFTFSGPLIKNRAFFFTSVEALKYDVTRLRSYTGDATILRPTSAQSAYLQTLLSGPNSNDTTRRIAGQLQTTLSTSSYPVTMRILQESEGKFTAPTRTYNWTTRLDFYHGERDSVDGRFTLANEDVDVLTAASLEAPSNGTLLDAEDYTAVGTWTHSFGNDVVNQLRVQLAVDDYRQISRSPDSTQIVIAGVMTYGHVATVPFIIDQKRYQFDDTVSWSRGKKDFKFGGSYRPVDALMITEIGFNGTFQFAAGQSLSRALSPADLALLTGPLAPPTDTTLTSLQAYNFGLPSIWQQGFGTPSFRAWQHNFGMFGQVSWKATSRLTLNLGTRLNYDGEPRPMDRNISLSPRIGFAWDPLGKGETVIRGGFGTFYAPVSLNIILSANLQRDDGRFINFQTRTLQDGAQSTQALWSYGLGLGKLPFRALNGAEIRAFGIIPAPGQLNRRIAIAADDYDNPSTVQASLGISQQLGRDFIVDLAFQVFHGVHLPIAIEGNYRESGQLVTVPGLPGSDLFGPRLERIDPTIAQKIVHSSEGSSIYYGMNASVVKRYGRRFQFRASYTFSKAIDDTTDFNGALTPFLPTRRYRDRGLSSFDIRHSFVISGAFESPYKTGQGIGWFRQIFADTTVSPIATLRSGFPFNLFIGRDVNGDLNTSDRPFYAPRNSGIGENYYGLDLRIAKRFFLNKEGRGASFEFIVEVTNLFNRVNFTRVNDVVCGTTAQPGFINGCDPKFLNGPFDFRGVRGLSPASPLAFVSAGPPRQFQFGVRFEI